MSQKDFGKAIGIQSETDGAFQSQISSYESGGKTPEISRLEKMLSLVGLSLADCLRWPGDTEGDDAASKLKQILGRGGDAAAAATEMIDWLHAKHVAGQPPSGPLRSRPRERGGLSVNHPS